MSISDENVLLFNGRPLKLKIQGTGLVEIGTYRVAQSDLVLIADNQGQACPAQFYVVSVATSGVTVSPAFGTCTDSIKVEKTAGGISIAMPGFLGPLEPEPARAKAVREKHVFRYEAGALTRNARLVKAD